MRTMLKIVALALIATDAMAQSSEAGECVYSGGTWDETTRTAPPYCQCPRGMQNGIKQGGICSKKDTFCDKCVPAGTRDNVRIVPREQKQEYAAACKQVCAQSKAARWDAAAAFGKQCEPLDPNGPHEAGECQLVRKPPPVVDETAFCRSICDTVLQARWVAEASEDERCQPYEEARHKYRPGACELHEIVKSGATSADLCRGSGGTPTRERGCVCRAGSVLQTRVCVPEPVRARETRVHWGLDGELVTILASQAYLPVGFAPRLTLRIVPPHGIYGLATVGPLIHGTGGAIPDTPIGATASLGVWVARGRLHLGLTADAHLIAIDRNLKMEALGLGGQFRARLYFGPCFAGLGAGATHLLPQTGWGAFVGTVGGGCELP